MFLVAAVYYSKYPISKDVISALGLCFSVIDTPEKIICDNAKYFTSRVYMDLLHTGSFH